MASCKYCENRLDEDNDKSSCPSCRHIEDQEQKRIENETKKTVELQAELSKSELLNQFYIEGLDKSDAKNESHLRNIELRAEHVKKLQAENERLNTIIDNRAEDKVVLEKYKKLQAELTELKAENADLKQEGDVMWKGLNGQIAKLQSELDTLSVESLDIQQAAEQNLTKQIDELQAELDKTQELLREALPHIECVNGLQSGLITEIGEYFEAL